MSLFSLWSYAFALEVEAWSMSRDERFSAALSQLAAGGAEIPDVIDYDAKLFPYEAWAKDEVTE